MAVRQVVGEGVKRAEHERMKAKTSKKTPSGSDQQKSLRTGVTPRGNCLDRLKDD